MHMHIIFIILLQNYEKAVHAQNYRLFWKGLCFNYLISTLRNAPYSLYHFIYSLWYNLIPDLLETSNLKFNSTLLSWCVFNSNDIIEAPDQTNCIHKLKSESNRVFFDTFYQKVTQAVKCNLTRVSNLDFFFKK